MEWEGSVKGEQQMATQDRQPRVAVVVVENRCYVARGNT